MFQSNTENDHQVGDENEENTLSVGLLITGSITTSTAGGKYSRLWRRSLCVSIFISLRKNLIRQESPPPSPTYVPCPQEPVPAAASEQLSRTSSSQSRCVIDIHDNEEEKEANAEEVVQTVKERNLNSLRRIGGVDRVAALLGSNDVELGIDGSQDQAWSTTNNNPVDEKGFWHFFLRACTRFSILLLLVSAALSFVTNDIDQQGLKDWWHDGVWLLAAVVVLVAFPSVGNFLHEKKRVKKLLENMKKLEVNVVRRGETRQVAISDVVQGDIVLLKEDDRVPADGLLVRGDDLEVDEVMNSKIDRDQNPFLFAGSKVTKGSGRMLVTSVGANTAMGKALSLVTHDPNEKRLLQARIEEPNDYNEIFTLCVSVVIALAVLIRLLCGKHNNSKASPEPKVNVSVDMLMKIFERISLKSKGNIWTLASALIAVVIGIQHGMPFAITASLCYWKKKVESCEVEVRNVSACGTMGLITIIYFDATGWLKCNEVKVDTVLIGEKAIKTRMDFEKGQFVLEALHQGIGVSVDSVLVPEISVSPKSALTSWLESKLGLNMEVLSPNLDILKDTKLSPDKKGAGVLIKSKDKDDQTRHLHWSGAASFILEKCSHYYDSSGGIHAMADQKRKFEQVIKDMEDGGLIPIAFAYNQNDEQEPVEEGLNLLALVALKYSCQEEIRSTVEDLREAGVCVKLFSEDELPDAKAIACGLGIYTPGSKDVAVEGEETRDLRSSRRIEKMEFATVIASCLPEDKLRIIQLSQQKGHIVAFYGGVTTRDTLALKEAEVGITDCTRSTELARESSDIKVTGLGSLVTIVKFGRCVYHNIQKFIQIQLTNCISGLLITLVTTIGTGTSPITGLELFWVNMVMCLLGGLMMSMELKGQELMRTNKPAVGSQSLLTKVVWRKIAIQVICQASVLLSFQFMGQAIPAWKNNDTRKTMIFNAFLLCQVFYLFNAMDLVEKEVLRVVLRNYGFLATLAAVMTLQVMVIELLGMVTDLVTLNAVQWASCCLVAAVAWGFYLAVKLLADILSKLSTDHSRCHVLWTRMAGPYVPHLVVPCFMLLVIHVLPGVFAAVNQYGNVPVVYE